MGRYDLLIVGGGVGGCAAALAAADLGLKVAMTEETDWIGGQLTSQAVPPDEHPWIESFGRTASYRRFRDGIRAYYRDHYPLNEAARRNPTLNPGEGGVSALCHEPRAALAVLEQMLASHRSFGNLRIFPRHRAVAAECQGDQVRAVQVEDLESGSRFAIDADYFLDATELGDLLPLAGVEYVTGAEARSETGEIHAPDAAQPDNVQALTWCFCMGYDPEGSHVIDKPAMYDFWRDYVPALCPAWPGPLLGWRASSPFTLAPVEYSLFSHRSRYSLWQYRRILSRRHYAANVPTQEATTVNWPQNDYLLTNILDKPRDVVDRALSEAKQLSLSLLYWLQTEAPHDHGEGQGYPGLYLRPDITGTSDGLAKAPYIRESRRIRAAFTVTEAHIGAEMRALEGERLAERFADSVGVGHYRIDLHPSTGGDNYIDIESRSFQIPLGALVPVRVTNLLPACKNLGVTHVTNGAYRLHPVEWNIGEAAGSLAAFCRRRSVTPHQVREQHDLSAEYQALLHDRGVQTAWPAIHDR